MTLQIKSNMFEGCSILAKRNLRSLVVEMTSAKTGSF